jgi:hypothetical protein
VYATKPSGVLGADIPYFFYLIEYKPVFPTICSISVHLTSIAFLASNVLKPEKLIRSVPNSKSLSLNRR